MALDSLVRNAVALANRVTGSLQAEVLHQAWIGSQADGSPLYATTIARQAIVQEGAKPHRLDTGEVVTTKAEIAFLAPIEANGAEGRQEPLDPRDILLLPSGTRGPVVDTRGGLVDPQSSRTYLLEVWI